MFQPTTSLLRPRQKLTEVLLPEHRPGVGTVAMGLGALRDQPEAGSLLHPLQRLLRNLQVAWVDEVVGGIHPGQRRRDLLQLGPGIVVPRGIELVDHVVCLELGQTALYTLFDIALRSLAG